MGEHDRKTPRGSIPSLSANFIPVFAGFDVWGYRWATTFGILALTQSLAPGFASLRRCPLIVSAMIYPGGDFPSKRRGQFDPSPAF